MHRQENIENLYCGHSGMHRVGSTPTCVDTYSLVPKPLVLSCNHHHILLCSLLKIRFPAFSHSLFLYLSRLMVPTPASAILSLLSTDSLCSSVLFYDFCSVTDELKQSKARKTPVMVTPIETIKLVSAVRPTLLTFLPNFLVS